MTTRSVSIDPFTDPRFVLVRPLGEGANGAVFLAKDRETGEHVALKKLFKLDQGSILRFKREFRALADINHPNLVKLYDLHRGQEAWFITMEYVSGKDFRRTFGAMATSSRESMSPANDIAEQASDDKAERALLTNFYDLACGVHAIHRAGMLHRDLKPTNAIISDTGRVVVLDFGLVRDIDAHDRVTQEGTVAGTPAYMAPEQALNEQLSEATDWYAFGVMLYEAISGYLPIEGANALTLLQNKLQEDPAPLHTGAPSEVLALCMRLLSRAPEKRPSGPEVLKALAAFSGGAPGRGATEEQSLLVDTHVLGQAAAAPSLYGRDAELAQLHAAIDDPGRSLVVHIRGASGNGKSALIEHFLDDSATTSLDPPIVLRSRCTEREAMPFKALDGVIDALVSYLSRQSDVTCAFLLPPDIADLARLFPVFERLGVLSRMRPLQSTEETRTGKRRHGNGETLMRRRAEQALRALVTNVATQGRLILWIDDMQWGDLDSAGLLRDWLEQPLEAPVVIILSYRSEEIQTSSSLTLLLAKPEQTAGHASLTIDVAPLQSNDVRALCMQRLAQLDVQEEMVARIVREADGNPFLAQQLTAIAEAKLARHDTSLEDLSAEALMQRASAWMGESARALLNVLAIAGRPVHPQLALGAAGVLTAGRAHIHTLRSLRLIRTREVGGERMLEVYHDRVREVVQAGLSPEERQRIHTQLLQQLEALGRRTDHDWLHALALGAGQRKLAVWHGWLAAKRASESLAFERAAELYSKCLELVDDEVPRYDLWTNLALAHAHCRRGYDAAKAYISAADLAPDTARRAELLQLAASHLVRSGRFEEGERIVQQLLQTYKPRIPKSRGGLFAALVWEHIRIGLRRMDVPAGRNEADIPSELKQLGLLYGTLSVETQLYAPLRAALFQARALRLALDYGDSRHAARALNLAAAIACVTGTRRAARRAAQLLNHAERLIARDNSEDLRLEALCARTLCALFVGELDKVLEPSAEVELLTKDKSAATIQGDYYYVFAVLMARISALQNLGRLLEARQLIHEFVARARATDNLGAVLQLTMNRVIDEQALDSCAGSRARLDAEYEKLPKGEFGVLNAVHLIAVMRAACSTRDFDWAFERVQELWEPYQRSLVHRSALLACLAHASHARLMLNHHVEAGAPGDPEPLVRNDIKQLERLPSTALRDAAILRTQARLACLRGDTQAAIRLLRQSLALFENTAMLHEIGHDQYCLGLLIGGAEGAQLVASAKHTLTEYGISDARANMRAYVPELAR